MRLDSANNLLWPIPLGIIRYRPSPFYTEWINIRKGVYDWHPCHVGPPLILMHAWIDDAQEEKDSSGNPKNEFMGESIRSLKTWLAAVGVKLCRTVSKFPSSFWPLYFATRLKKLPQRLETAPGLTLCLIDKAGRVARQRGRQNAGKWLCNLLNRREDDLLEEGLSVPRNARQIFKKVDSTILTHRRIKLLRQIAQNQKLVRCARHLPRLSVSVIEFLALKINGDCKSLDFDWRFIHEVSQEEEVGRDRWSIFSHFIALRDLLDTLGEKQEIHLRSLKQFDNLYKKFLGRVDPEILPELLKVQLPPPPIPFDEHNDHIRPISDGLSLIREGAYQHNCIVGYWYEIVNKKSCYAYLGLNKYGLDRVTILIKRDPDGDKNWRIFDIRIKHGGKPKESTSFAIAEWLRQGQNLNSLADVLPKRHETAA